MRPSLGFILNRINIIPRRVKRRQAGYRFLHDNPFNLVHIIGLALMVLSGNYLITQVKPLKAARHRAQVVMISGRASHHE